MPRKKKPTDEEQERIKRFTWYEGDVIWHPPEPEPEPQEPDQIPPRRRRR